MQECESWSRKTAACENSSHRFGLWGKKIRRLAWAASQSSRGPRCARADRSLRHRRRGHTPLPLLCSAGVRMAARYVLKAILVDLSGTLHIEDSAVPGSQEALKRLRNAPVAIRFVTNTTKESKRDLLERLRKLEFDIAEDEIFTSLTAARNLLEQKQVRPLLLVDDNALHDFRGIPTNDPNAVVVGLAPEHLNNQMMNKAFRLILDGAPLIAIHKARYYKRKDGLALGPGPFVTGLEYATDTKATVVGKPETTFFLEALRGIGCKPEETVMIGDDCRDDVGGAQNAGMLGILVKTGKYRAADEDKIKPAPYLTCESFPQAVDHILQHLL